MDSGRGPLSAHTHFGVQSGHITGRDHCAFLSSRFEITIFSFINRLIASQLVLVVLFGSFGRMRRVTGQCEIEQIPSVGNPDNVNRRKLDYTTFLKRVSQVPYFNGKGAIFSEFKVIWF